jgi:aminoglycoside phosphotransferase (APT) family kinase protein
LADTAVPVPRVHALCEDDAVIGSAFYLMEYLDGRIFWDQRLPEVVDPADRCAMFGSMNAVIAALHVVDYGAVGLGDFGRPGNYMGRQIARWSRQYRASEAETIAAMVVARYPRPVNASRATVRIRDLVSSERASRPALSYVRLTGGSIAAILHQSEESSD